MTVPDELVQADCPHPPEEIIELLDEGRANDAGISSRHQCLDCGAIVGEGAS